MDAVLGLSMTPTTVGLVLVEGQDADGATMDKEEFAVHDRGLASAVNASEKAAAAVLRTEAIAAARGHRLHSIGVTWSEDADTEASMLLESLSESGFDNVVAVRLPEATEALARGIAGVIGYEITAVCVIQPDAVVVLVVDTVDNAVSTAVNHSVSTDEDLARWLSTVFTQVEWQPEALVLVGSCTDLHAITPHLEDVLAVPVFVPAEAQLALAKGAAMASAQTPDFFVDDVVEDTRRPAGQRRRSWPVSHVGAAGAMLGVGVVTFVVSGSLAIGLQLTSGESAQPVSTPPTAATSDMHPAVKAALPGPAAAPPAVEAALPPAPEELPPPPDAAIEPAPVAEPVIPEAPAADPLAPPAGVLPDPAVDPALAGTVPPPPGAVEPAVPAPVPEEKPGLLQRLRDKLSGIGQPDNPPPVDQAPVPPLPQDVPPPPPA